MIGKLIGFGLMAIGFIVVWNWFLGKWVIKIFSELGFLP